MTEPMRVLIVDDHPMYRHGLRAAVEDDACLEVVADAADGASAVELALELQPDVIVMDLKMPGVSGVEATRAITSASPHIAVLVLTMFDEDDSVFTAIQAGARGYLLKGAGPSEIVRAIHAVGRGEAIFGPAVALRVLDAFSGRSAPARVAFPELTSREREILDLVARASTNGEIARQLHLSDKTVRNHISNILTKLQVADRAHAIVRAREAGLGRGTPT
ncbi:response regulator [Cellulomonas palmilytica]|uniref:response regulator n=1 Tax=Cellulomonas palmilytica TaxID=2608402 RepID=UPI001F1BB6D8|nr:response regulator transcription factor [Cellulomonas palmilytica]UJP41326.1 response regulator transcription factor [Cellulomonas palmilytica]